MIRDLLPRLFAGDRLTREETASAIASIVRGEIDEVRVAAFLALLAHRGETDEELTGAAQALRSEAIPFPPRAGVILDTCGTGGDGSHSFNVSTCVALVAAGAGVPVAKHGNRSVSSRSGSADVLEALGARIDLGPLGAARALEETGFCFLFARRFHPSMRNVARVRETLGVRTLFNWIGPLANPAGATHQLVGIPDGSRLETMARVLQALGAVRALVVHGGGGLDELSLENGNEAVLVEQGSPLRRLRIDAADLGFSSAPHTALQGGDAAANAVIIRSLLSGERGAKRDAVVLNAAAALWVAGRAESVKAGVAVAEEALDSGAAARTLARYVEFTHAMGTD